MVFRSIVWIPANSYALAVYWTISNDQIRRRGKINRVLFSHDIIHTHRLINNFSLCCTLLCIVGTGTKGLWQTGTNSCGLIGDSRVALRFPGTTKKKKKTEEMCFRVRYGGWAHLSVFGYTYRQTTVSDVAPAATSRLNSRSTLHGR